MREKREKKEKKEKEKRGGCVPVWGGGGPEVCTYMRVVCVCVSVCVCVCHALHPVLPNVFFFLFIITLHAPSCPRLIAPRVLLTNHDHPLHPPSLGIEGEGLGQNSFETLGLLFLGVREKEKDGKKKRKKRELNKGINLLVLLPLDTLCFRPFLIFFHRGRRRSR